MESTTGNNEIEEILCGENIGYILPESTFFLPTEYKILQNQENSNFVKCIKMKKNGKILLYYKINELKTFTSIFPLMDSDDLIHSIQNILAAVIAVKKNGFLSYQNVVISLDHIFIDPATYTISLLYIPLAKRLYKDGLAFESALKSNIVKIIQDCKNFSEQKRQMLIDDFSNGFIMLEELYTRLSGESAYGISTLEKRYKDKYKYQMKMISVDASSPIEILISKDEFVIGRKQGSVDGLITFSRMIGRVHCKVLYQNGQYAVVDLNSANGTFVNNIRLQPEQKYALKNGDVLRLAKSDFKVQII